MYKNYARKRPELKGRFKLLIMKISMTAIVLCLVNLHIAAGVMGQKVSLTAKSITLRQALHEINKQTGYNFVWSTNKVNSNTKVSIHVNQESLAKVLDDILEGLPLQYGISGNMITIKEKPISDELSGINIKELQKRVSGRVETEKGEPLVGATVLNTKTGKSSKTDQQGTFVIEGTDGDNLEISYLGYTPQIIKIGSVEFYLIKLKASEESIQEVQIVNTGFQSISKERATGAFGTVSKEQLEKPSLSIAQRLIGTNAGVQAKLDADGKPRFEIRGQSSLYADAAPLVVVDGFPIQGDFESINPNDVESVTILKDAAAASIWGARAANGVIVVVTRNANKNIPLKVDLQAFTRIGSKMDLDYINPLASSAQTVEYEKMAFNKWGGSSMAGILEEVGYSFSPATVLIAEHHLGYISLQERDAGLERLKSFNNKKQISDNLLANPINQQYNLSLQGSSGKMNNFMSVLYEKNQSNFKRTANDKYLINFRNNTQLLKWMRLDLAAMLNIANNNNSGMALTSSNPFILTEANSSAFDIGITDIAPYEMLLDENGNYTNISQFYSPILDREVPINRFPYSDWTYNPIREINARDLSRKEVNTRLQAGLSFTPIKGLTYDIKGQYEIFNANTRNYYGEDSFFARNTVNTTTSWDRVANRLTPNLNNGAILDQMRSKTTSWNIRNQISYNTEINDHHAINAVAGTELSNRVIEYFEHPRTYGYNDETLTVGSFPNGPGGPFARITDWMGYNQTFKYTNLFTYNTQRFFSLFGNAAYTYKGKYTLSGSIRTDASNMITDDPSYRYSPFWSIGGSWNIGREHFMTSTSDWLDRLSLRLTHGYNGNVDPTTAFRPLIAVASAPNVFTNDYTATISSYGNPTLRWEKTGSWNAGLDFSTFKGKLYGKIDFYRKEGKDLIANIAIPSINGTTRQKLNNAEMLNTGIELELGTRLSIKENDITWNGSINFSYNKNKISKLFLANHVPYEMTLGGTYSYVEGFDANSQWMYEYAGIRDNQPVIKGANGAFHTLNAFAPGDGRDFMINTGTKVAPYTLGLANSFKIYDFDLSFIITGKFGHVFKKQGFNYPLLWTSRLLPNARLDDVLNGNPEEIVPLPLNENEPMFYFWPRFTEQMSYLSANASHIRMQEVYLSYNLPISRWKGLGNTRANIFFQGNDLFTHTFNDLGEDPEYPLGTLNPRPKFTFGVKASF